MRKLLLAGISICLASAALADRTMYVMLKRESPSAPVVAFKATCSEDVFQKVRAASATGGAGAGKIRFNEFTIKKTTDKATPLLHKALVDNENIPSVVLSFYRPSASRSEVKYYTITLTQARISQLKRGSTPSESITFVFGKLGVR